MSAHRPNTLTSYPIEKIPPANKALNKTRYAKQAEAGHLQSMCSLQKTKILETETLRNMTSPTHRSLSRRQKLSNSVTRSQTQTLHKLISSFSKQ